MRGLLRGNNKGWVCEGRSGCLDMAAGGAGACCPSAAIVKVSGGDGACYGGENYKPTA